MANGSIAPGVRCWCPPSDEGTQVADGDADEHAAPGHHAEARDAEADLGAADVVEAELAE